MTPRTPIVVANTAGFAQALAAIDPELLRDAIDQARLTAGDELIARTRLAEGELATLSAANHRPIRRFRRHP